MTARAYELDIHADVGVMESDAEDVAAVTEIKGLFLADRFSSDDMSSVKSPDSGTNSAQQPQSDSSPATPNSSGILNGMIGKSEVALEEKISKKNIEENGKKLKGEAFKRWFGNWEGESGDASKVVDEEGRPQVAVRGTWEMFNVFRRDKLGSEGRDGDVETPSRSFVGHWFSRAEDANREQYLELAEVYLNIGRPEVYESLEEMDWDLLGERDGEPERLAERRELGEALRKRAGGGGV